MIQHLLEFAGAASLQALPELFQDDARLAEAAARPRSPPRGRAGPETALLVQPPFQPPCQPD